MSSLQNKRILLGVTGGIAAYKSADLVRRLQDHGANVQVVLTKAAQEFITPLTMQALSGHPVHTNLLDPEAEAGMGHIQLARWADLILIAPASADFIARLVHGEGGDLLATLCLATRAKVAIAPAMNQAMWDNPATTQNIQTAAQRGLAIFGPGSGSQACGDVGLGRMLEANNIATMASQLFRSQLLDGKTVVITAGPTREAIDPVRYISNHSSGKMGYAIATAAAEAGAKVILISGSTQLPTPERVTFIQINSALDMLSAVNKYMDNAHIFIGSAAVADYRPEEYLDQKMKKSKADTLTLNFIKNPDIIAQVAEQYTSAYCVGFAAETNNVITYAKNKLEKKSLDMIIANDVSDTSIGFNSEDNAATIIHKDKEDNITLPKMNKSQLAQEIIQIISKNC